MSTIVLESVLIVLLVLANGIFSMSELAVVSSRKSRLQRLANGGNASAGVALDLAGNPGRFLSTAQIGITLVGILAGAFGGATVAEQIGIRLATRPILAPYAEAIGVVVVVAAITYLSVVFGELVPKRLALNNPEAIASLVARPMTWLSVVASPLVNLLSHSSDVVVRLLRVRPPAGPPVTSEEIRLLLEQGTRAGVFEEAEQDIVESVFRLANRRASALMTPRPDIVWLDASAPDEAAQRKMAEAPLSRFPVCDQSIDNVIGIVKAKDYFAGRLADPTASLLDFVTEPLYVPESVSALNALEVLKRANGHMAPVIDEHGSIEGLVTSSDVMEAIVGHPVDDKTASESEVVRRDDGSWLLDGSLLIDEFRELFPVAGSGTAERETYETLAGWILAQLGYVPSVGEHFASQGLRVEIVDMDGNRIDKVLVLPVSDARA